MWCQTFLKSFHRKSQHHFCIIWKNTIIFLNDKVDFYISSCSTIIPFDAFTFIPSKWKLFKICIYTQTKSKCSHQLVYTSIFLPLTPWDYKNVNLRFSVWHRWCTIWIGAAMFTQHMLLRFLPSLFNPRSLGFLCMWSLGWKQHTLLCCPYFFSSRNYCKVFIKFTFYIPKVSCCE